MRSLTLLFLFAVLLSARENPFVPIGSEVQKHTEAQTDAQVVNFQYIRFLFSEGRLRIETKDRLKKHYAIHNPTRIILDFEGKSDFPSRQRRVDPAPFHEIRMGGHEGYYRTVIELDTPSDYGIEPFEYGYILTLKPHEPVSGPAE